MNILIILCSNFIDTKPGTTPITISGHCKLAWQITQPTCRMGSQSLEAIRISFSKEMCLTLGGEPNASTEASRRKTTAARCAHIKCLTRLRSPVEDKTFYEVGVAQDHNLLSVPKHRDRKHHKREAESGRPAVKMPEKKRNQPV